MAKDIIKNIPLTLDINARKRLNGTVDISLYSKDIATGQFEFTFIDEDGDPVVLDETYSAQALVKYEGSSKTYLNDMIIEGNIIRFIFPHDFITKDGTITMYIYVTKDNYTSDVAAISFPVFVSEIDKDLDPNISVHYIGKIEQLIEDMKNNIKEKENELLNGMLSNTTVKDIEGYYQQFNAVIAELSETKDYHSLPEITVARGGENTLGERLDKEHNDTTTQLTQTDFVEELRNHNASNDKMRFMVTDDRILEINVPLGGKKYASYVLRKDGNDDFMKFGSGDLVELEDGEAKYMFASYETTTGTWTKAVNNPNHYARTIGDTAEGTFYGTGFDIFTIFDDRGGMWEIAVDGEKVFEWSTNKQAHGGLNTSGLIEGVRGLEEKEHTWVATFLGEDPNFPPVGDKRARGWFVSPSSFDNPSASANRPDRHVLHVFKKGVAKDTIAKVLHTASNKEFAFSSKPSGTSSKVYWFPDHGTGTAFAVEQSLYVDNVLTDMSESKIDDGYVDCTNVKVVQRLNMIHPDDPEPLAEATVIHSYNSRGATYKVNWKWLKATRVTGYVGMFSVYRPAVDRLRTSIGNTYDAWKDDGSATPLFEEKDLASSYVFYNADGEARFRDFAVAMTIHDIGESFRWGATNRLDTKPADPQDYLVWLQHRDATMQKLYPQIYDGAEVQPGEEFNFGATIFLGVLPYASELLK